MVAELKPPYVGGAESLSGYSVTSLQPTIDRPIRFVRGFVLGNRFGERYSETMRSNVELNAGS
jgi:hypothetical protein